MSTEMIVNGDAAGVVRPQTEGPLCAKLNWYPTLNCGVKLPATAAEPPAINSIVFSVQITYSLRFRGVRFQGGAN